MICPQKEFQACALKRGRFTKRSRGTKRRRTEDQIRVFEAKTGSTLQKAKYFKQVDSKPSSPPNNSQSQPSDSLDSLLAGEFLQLSITNLTEIDSLFLIYCIKGCYILVFCICRSCDIWRR